MREAPPRSSSRAKPLPWSATTTIPRSGYCWRKARAPATADSAVAVEDRKQRTRASGALSATACMRSLGFGGAAHDLDVVGGVEQQLQPSPSSTLSLATRTRRSGRSPAMTAISSHATSGAPGDGRSPGWAEANRRTGQGLCSPLYVDQWQPPPCAIPPAADAAHQRAGPYGIGARIGGLTRTATRAFPHAGRRHGPVPSDDAAAPNAG